MLIILSPAKTIDFKRNSIVNSPSIPSFIKEADELITCLKKLKPIDLSSLMGISAKLADLNFERFMKWNINHSPEITRLAIFAFNGDVYEGLQAASLSKESLEFLNNHLRILSGLYGVLKPFDQIMEYRLEMGTKLKTKKGADLYKFWGQKITKNIHEAMHSSDGEKVLINLASNEYFKAIDTGKIKYPVITPVFKEYKDGELQFISFFAKKARGLMTRFIATEKLTNAEDIKFFNLERYHFNNDLSDNTQWLFIR